MTQIYDPINYFAMHFQNITTGDTIAPTIPILLSPISGAIVTGTVNLLRSGVVDTGVGMSGYIYQISTGSAFTTFITSGFTSNTGITQNGLTD